MRAIGNTWIDGRTLSVGHAQARASRTECEILEALANDRRIVSHDELAAGRQISRVSMSAAVFRLRKKLASIGSDIEITTHYGLGWSLRDPTAPTTLTVTPEQLSAIKTAITALETSNPRIAAIAWSAL